MKHILFISLLLLGLWACNSDELETVMVDLPENSFSFKPISGGAIMHYTLPSDPNIVGLKVRYLNTFGVETLREGSSTCDSLVLVGFSEAREAVEAQVTLVYFDGAESQPFDVTFSTSDSAPIAFMKSVDCHSNWEGFSLTYKVPEGANGMAHVFYVGKDPNTNLTDTLLIESFFLEETEGDQDITSYIMQQDIAAPTVVVKVEDFLGYMVGEKVWEQVTNLQMNKLDAANFDFYCDNALTDENLKIGKEYLFDGDKKGEICFTDNKHHTFIAGPDAAGAHAHPMYVDMKQNRMVATVRLYNLLKNNALSNTWGAGAAAVCQYYNYDELPNEVTVYALKDDAWVAPSSEEDAYDYLNGLDGWVKVASFKEDPGLDQKQRWCASTWAMNDWSTPPDLVTIKAADEEYMNIIAPALGQEDGYRYLKIVINDVFPSRAQNENTAKYVQFHELEIYTD